MLTNIFIIIGVILIAFNTLFILSASKLSSKCDDWEEEIVQDIKEISYIR